MLENISELNNLHFDFEYKKRFIHAYLNETNYFTFNTPLLKVLKPVHVSFNKKKNLSKNYIILELNENQNMHQELDDMAIMVNKIHEISQVNIQKNSIKWFNTEFDEIGLDMKVKRPIDNQKEKNFIKILINNDDELLQKVEKLQKDCYISCKLGYKGLKVNSDHLMEEYILYNFMDEEELNEINLYNEQNNELIEIIGEEIENEDNNEIIENNELLDENNELLDENNQLLAENNELLNEDNELLDENNELLNEDNELLDEDNELLDENEHRELIENLTLDNSKIIKYGTNNELELNTIEKNKKTKKEKEKILKDKRLKNINININKNNLFENKKNTLEKIDYNKKKDKRNNLKFATRKLKVLKFVD